MITHNLFSTPIKIISVPNFNEVKDIVIKSFKTNFNKNFNQNLSEEENIKTALYFTEEINNFWKEIAKEKRDIKLITSWSNFHKKFDFATPHSHGDCLLAAVFYIQTSDKSGDILLHDPRGGVYFELETDIDTQGKLADSRKYFRIKPKDGDLIIFPAYLIHSVEPNMTDETRISLAMLFK
jgi:uncharacterized protein (TIGR02466 family)